MIHVTCRCHAHTPQPLQVPKGLGAAWHFKAVEVLNLKTGAKVGRCPLGPVHCEHVLQRLGSLFVHAGVAHSVPHRRVAAP